MAQVGRAPSARSDIPPFHAMAMARAAEERAGGGANVLHLEVGQPSTPAPKGALEAAHEAMASRALGYTNAPGLPALRQRIARHYADWDTFEALPSVWQADDEALAAHRGRHAQRQQLRQLGADRGAIGPERIQDAFELRRRVLEVVGQHRVSRTQAVQQREPARGRADGGNHREHLQTPPRLPDETLRRLR